MSMFPEIGSTVTNVSTTKTGTAARIDFSDGSSIYVKYDALILNAPKDIQIRSTKPIVHVERAKKSRVEQHFANLPKKMMSSIGQSSLGNISGRAQSGKPIMDNGKISEEALLKAKLRSESRIEKLSAKWDSEHPSGESAIAAMNGS